MAGEYIGVIVIDPSIESKIRTKHNITPVEVRQALQHPAATEGAWENDPEHGERYVVLGQLGRRDVMGWLLDGDHGGGTWVLKSARFLVD